MMSFITQYFEIILCALVLISGILSALDTFYFSKKRNASDKAPWILEQGRSFFPVLLAVFVIRSFIVEPYRIPSGSLKPTLTTGDFIVVNKFIYGIRLPVLHKKILTLREPKRGDIVVFRWPVNPSIDFVKRVIGVPGDHVSYHDKILTINGQIVSEKMLNYAMESEPEQGTFKVAESQENLLGVKHHIYTRPDINDNGFDITVPKGQYFMMGDNRDNSNDSRYWGFVPEENIVGEAICVLISWNAETDSIRWNRIGRGIA